MKKVVLSDSCVLKRLEEPSVYNIDTDELYTLDEEAYRFLLNCRKPTPPGGVDREFLKFCLDEGILVERDRGENTARLQSHPSPFPSLRYLEVLLTERCNLRCRHCYIDDTGGDELPFDDLLSVLEEFESIGGLRCLLSGGEPMLHSRFWDINSVVRDFSFRTVLITNGMFIDRATVRLLRVHEVQVSIDGLEDSHDLVRGKGTFRRALESIYLLKEAGIDVSVATMIYSSNRNDFPLLRSLFEDIGIKEWSIDVPCPAGRLARNRDLILPYEDAVRLLEYGFSSGSHSSSPGYACGSHLMCLTGEGRFVRCGFFRDEPVGDVDDGLIKSWNRLHHWRLDELNCNCPHLHNCRGGCRYRAYIHYGSLQSPDPLYCGIYGVEIKTTQRKRDSKSKRRCAYEDNKGHKEVFRDL